jgi:hypothetical protein
MRTLPSAAAWVAVLLLLGCTAQETPAEPPPAAAGADEYARPAGRPLSARDLPARPEIAGSVSYDIGYEGVLTLTGRCLALVSRTGGATIPIFPAGTAWEAAGERLRVNGTAVRVGELMSSGGTPTQREFWNDLPPAYRAHAPVPAGCSAANYLLVSGPVTAGP